MDVSVKQIRSFVAVSRLGSFTRAAADLNVTQPTLTVQIRRFEDALGLKLFDRNTRSVTLTQTGRDMLPVFENLLQDLDLALANARDAAAERRGIVRLAALPSVAASLLPPVIRRFRAERPGVSFHLKDVVANRVLALLLSEDVDLGITGGPVEAGALEVLAVWRDDLQVVFPDGHPIETVERITAGVLAGYSHVLMDASTSVRAVTDAAFQAAGHRPAIICEATTMMTAVAMVQAGLGLTLLPAAAREIAAMPGLKARRIDDPAFARRLMLVKKLGRSLAPLVQTFAGALVEGMPREQ